MEQSTVSPHPKPRVPFKQLSTEERAALVRAIAGKYRELMRPSDEFLARKHVEFELEEILHADRA
jgi:hypothetical protein